MFSRLGYLILGRVLEVDPGSNFGLNPVAFQIGCTAMIFVFIFLFFLDIFWLNRNRPIQIMKTVHKGEGEPKIRWFLLVFGIFTLGFGYLIAIKIKDPLASLLYFFVAVLLVIIGTYALFISASIFILKLLRKNTAYYYQPQHFINLGNLLTRMKQNGAGLASITILITMTLVTVNTTATMFWSSNKLVDSEVPTDLVYAHNGKSKDPTNLLKKQAAKEGVKIVNERIVKSCGIGHINLKNDKVKLSQTDLSWKEITGGQLCNIEGMTISNLHSLINKSYKLSPHEVIIAKEGGYPFPTITMGDQTFKVKRVVKKFDNFSKEFGVETMCLVFANERIMINQINKFCDSSKKNIEERITSYHLVKLNGSREQQLKLASKFYGFKFKVESMDLAKTFISSALFVGILSTLAFILATFFILYYKQLSEGYADAKRYHTLERVGLSKIEIQRVINSQLKVVFYLPLAVASVHLLFATPIISRILTIFGIKDIKFFMVVNCFGLLFFGLCYVGMYKATSKVYYLIVTKLNIKDIYIDESF